MRQCRRHRQVVAAAAEAAAIQRGAGKDRPFTLGGLRLERRGAFPKHVKVSANIVAWLEKDVVDWIRTKTGWL
jgi:hypothetical protein